MRNTEAASYARWAAMVAGAIVLVVAGTYVHRAIRQARARRAEPPSIPTTVERQSTEFTYSKTEQNGTVLTIHAARATQFKDRGRAVLEDVQITIHGGGGKRNDVVHTRECAYEQSSGDARCEGDVEIRMEAANPATGGPVGQPLDVKTSNLSFNGQTGDASTPAPVEFSFPQGQGRGIGITYSAGDATMRIEHSVEFELTPSERTGGLPVSAKGSSLEIRRKQGVVELEGPAIVRQGDRELITENISISLDQDFHAQQVVAEGHPMIRAAEHGDAFAVSANKFMASLSADGWVQRIVADGGVTGTRKTPSGTDRFSSGRFDLTMLPQHNLAKEMLASGGVASEMQKGGDSRVLKTDSLRVKFSPGQQPVRRRARSRGDLKDSQRIESAETLGPATLESRVGSETTSIHGNKLVAQFGATGHIERLFGHAGVEVRSQTSGRAPQVSTAEELAMTLGPDGQWGTVEETGDVRLHDVNRQATAAHATFARASGVATLNGSPVISDASSRTTVGGSVTINQKSGDLHATGGVLSTDSPTVQGNSAGLGSGAPHIFADTLSGSASSGHVVYSGHARLWQGDFVMDADQIELWRDEKKMQAMGHVVAVLPQASGPLANFSGKVRKSAAQSPSKSSQKPPESTVWQIHAPLLTYLFDQGKVHFEGGVIARSSQGSLESRTLDVFLGSASTPASLASRSTVARASSSQPSGIRSAQQMSRIFAQGAVIVRQGDRRGSAEQAEYTAADGKFVLSGGQPTLTDASGDTTTGDSLTFFLANDTILVDSEKGSRTLTKHRVEK